MPYGALAKLCRVPYTMAKFVVFEKVMESIYQRVDKATASGGMQTSLNLLGGLIAGMAAAVVSQPADTMLSKINKRNSDSAAASAVSERVCSWLAP